MPVFMDLHIGQGLTARDVAIAHQLDLKHQDKFCCKCLTYWVDEARGNAYCLIEAPDRNAVYELHRKSHEQLPDEIIEVDKRVIKAFLGRIHDPEVVDYIIDQKIKVFQDPAFRVVMIIELKDPVSLSSEMKKEQAEELLLRSKGIIRNVIRKNEGVDSEEDGQEIVATFTSAIQAILCATDIQSFLQVDLDKLNLRIGIHAGTPVEKGEELFGSTLKMARFLGQVSPNRILMSHSVKNLIDTSGERSLINSKYIKSLSKADEEFSSKLVKVLNDNWQNSNFEIEDMYKAMAISKSQLYRKCIQLTRLSSNRLLRDFRLEKAKSMLLTNRLNVAQTAFECGFNSPSYFSKCFQKKFGLKPQSYTEIKD